MIEAQNDNSLILYPSNGEDINVVIKGDSVWANLKSISDIFSTDSVNISTHLEDIFDEGELSRADHFKQFKSVNLVTDEAYYSQDAIISVGYRINSKKATQFRIWSAKTLSQFITDGFLINEELLRSDPKKLNVLAAKIRELRANEKNVYASVRECFKIAASDYQPSSSEVKKFYSLLQDKFHHAITQMTSSKLILDRASYEDDKMGLQSIQGIIPTRREAETGKNYLSENEIYRMHLLSEQFLLYAESTSLSGKEMTMKGLNVQLDNLLRLNGYPVFEGYVDFLKDKAMDHAKREHETYIEIKKLEHIGVNVDLELFYIGEYNEYKEQTSQITPQQLNKALTVQ
jgi:hypothetical protein